MSSVKSKNPTKAEIAAGCRRYDRRLKASGATWHLELVLSREGEEKVLATIAQYKNLGEFTPDMRRMVVEAVRAVLAGIGTERAGVRHGDKMTAQETEPTKRGRK